MRLSLELVCGSSEVNHEHEGYYDPTEGLLHPKHEEIAAWCRANNISHNISPTFQHGVWHSDAYLYFEPKQIKTIARMLKHVCFRGDILDIKGRLTPLEERGVRAVAEAEGWKVES